MSTPFKVVFTVTPENIDFDLQFIESIDQGVVDIFNHEVKIVEAIYVGQPVDPSLKIRVDEYVWSVIRKYKLNCIGTEWK